MNDIILVNIGLVPLIIGVIAVFKTAGLPSRLAPLLSLILGIGSVFLLPYSYGIGVQVLIGIGTGLSASGLYSGAKATVTPKVEPF
jgi:hypothetical protein